MEFGDDWLLSRFLFLIPVILSLTVHEWAHAFSAYLLGDDTASRLGRVTLNPLEHIDPIGTLILPLLGVPFGWAKPVPINPGNFRYGVGLRSGLFITAAAGPASNMCLALLAALGLGCVARFAPDWLYGPQEIHSAIHWVILLNVMLACFNLLPIPPLDGSRIVDVWMPDALRPTWDQFATMAPLALLGVIILPVTLGINILYYPMIWVTTLEEFVLP